MAMLPFILGLAVGIAFYFWQQNRFNHKLTLMLDLFIHKSDQVTSLRPISLVRREIMALLNYSRQLEAELKTQKKLLENAPIGYLQVDQENQLLYCNQQAKKLLQINRWQPGQVRLLLELVRSYELDQLIQKTRCCQTPQEQEWVFYPSSYDITEEIKPITLKATSYHLPLENVAVFLENRQPLVEISQSRDRAFSDITHELRTPLTSISLVAERLQTRISDPEKRWVEQMWKETRRLINLVQDWLDLSQINQDPSQTLNYQDCELTELIVASWQTLEPLAKHKQINLFYSGPDTCSIQADKSRLTQVFLNLFDNAIKHSPHQGTIRVEIKIIVGWIIINIIDSGSGFADRDLPYVFDRLYRGDSSRSRQSDSGGSGLGLSIVQQIIQSHHGQVEAKNHPETRGGWLRISLPSDDPD